MNLFKVLASSRKGIPEEQTSAMLAWLLNPYLEHGLGFVFLNKFLTKVDSERTTNCFNNILQPILRSKKMEDTLKFSLDIEFNVNQSFIDIVVFINDIIISIENKVNCESASKDQLVLQYDGLKQKYGQEYKVIIVFLVPDDMNNSILDEFDALQVNSPDNKVIITWDIISEIIQEILNEEQNCEIQPMSEYLRHSLKAFSCLIKDNFSGYYYETTKNYGNLNPLALGRKTFEQISKDQNITYVGVNYGIVGLLMQKKGRFRNNYISIYK